MGRIKTLSDIAAMLTATGQFRVLRRVPLDVTTFQEPDGEPVLVGVAVDVETSALDIATCEVIDLGMVKFSYGAASGRIFSILDRFESLQAPCAPLAPEIRRLTGLMDAQLAGKAIDPAAVERFLDGVNVLIAHHARFDRPVVERHWRAFTRYPWACSLEQVDWLGEGVDGRRLRDVLAATGLFHDAHRAAADALALVHVLAAGLPSGRPTLEVLLETARRPTVVLWAEKASFAHTPALRQRGYRWSPGSGGAPRAWWAEFDLSSVDAEIEFLLNTVYAGSRAGPSGVGVTARTRFRDLGEIATDRIAIRPT